MSLPADMRSKNVSTLPIFITPGLNEPVDMDSFLALAMAELESLAAGLDGVRVFGREGTFTLKCLLIFVCADAPGGDKVTHMAGHGGYMPGRLRPYHGVLVGTKYYFPPVDPVTGEVLFSVSSTPLATCTSHTTHQQAASVEVMRTARRPAAHIKREVRLTGVSGRSPLLGVLQAEKDVVDSYVAASKILEKMSEEYQSAARTVPAEQARQLRDIHAHHAGFKADDWLFFLLCGAEVLLYGCVPDDFYDMVMCLCRAGRLLFRPSPLTPTDLDKAEWEIFKFLDSFYKLVYRGLPERLRICPFMFATLLDVVTTIRQCGPIWCYWQFPLERYIGTLPPMIRSRSRPHKALVNAMQQRDRAELLLKIAARECPEDWAVAEGTVVRGTAALTWELALPSADAAEIMVLRPIEKCQELHGAELAAQQRYHTAVAIWLTVL
eukprot:contig_3357_g707